MQVTHIANVYSRPGRLGRGGSKQAEPEAPGPVEDQGESRPDPLDHGAGAETRVIAPDDSPLTAGQAKALAVALAEQIKEAEPILADSLHELAEAKIITPRYV